MLQDIRFGFRLLRRTPGFSTLVILCLSVGIAATTSVLSWIEGILLRPFPLVAHQDRMVALTGADRNGRTEVSWPDLLDLRRNSTSVEAYIAEHIGGATLNIGDRADRATGSVVSANYFQALGIRPILGRTFLPAEETGSNAHAVAVISYRMWKQRYKGNPEIIGREQMLNGIKHTIVGVTPEGFEGTFVGYAFQFWVPASMEETFDGGGYKLENRDARWIEGFAVLKPGVTLEQAQSEMSAIAGRLQTTYPNTNRGRTFKLYPLWQTPFNNAGTLFPTLRISLVVAFSVLLIACANVGNLLLVRSFARRHEMTVRLSIGAGRMRLLRQLFTEGLILSSISTGCGFVLAYWCRDLIRLSFPPPAAGILINLPAAMDQRVLMIGAGLSLVATVLFGLIPALETRKIDLAVAMRSESDGVVGGHGKAWIRSGLVLIQVSLSFILLVGAALLVKSLRAMQNTDPGFSTDGVLTAYVDMVSVGYDPPRIRNFQDRLSERMRGMPGVESVAWIRTVPFGYRSYPSAIVAIDNFVTNPGEAPVIDYNEVGPAYLATAGIPLISGRDFTAGDNEISAPVAIVNETMVQRFWRGENPVGRRLRVTDRWLRVVGVAKNARYSSLLETSKPFFYIPLRQGAGGGQNLAIRTTIAPRGMANALVRQIKALDSNLAPGELITMREQVDRRSWSQRAAVTLLGIFGGIALMLAGVGLYGVMSYAVSQSSRELSLRMALGANVSDLVRIVMARGLGLALAGMAFGTAFALGLTGLMADMLYRVSPRDPASFALAFAVMTLASLAACFFPALRAARADPAHTLRQ